MKDVFIQSGFEGVCDQCSEELEMGHCVNPECEILRQNLVQYSPDSGLVSSPIAETK